MVQSSESRTLVISTSFRKSITPITYTNQPGQFFVLNPNSAYKNLKRLLMKYYQFRVEQEAHVRVVDDQERGIGTPSSMTYPKIGRRWV